ncbi:MAG: hypothetical protein RR349_08100 [Oscillospiraceae bacterium]
MEEQICKACKHFRLHYIKTGRKYHELTYGHCVYPRLKKRNALQKACEYYKNKE